MARRQPPVHLIHFPISQGGRTLRLLLRYGRIPYKENLALRYTEDPAWNPKGTLPFLSVGTERAFGLWPPIRLLIKRRQLLLPLLGREETSELRVYQWIEWFHTSFKEDVLAPTLREKVFKAIGGRAPDAQSLLRARRFLSSHLAFLEETLSDNSWLSGAAMTVADFTAVAALSCVEYTGNIAWNEVPHTKIWYLRVKSQPYYKTLLKDRIQKVPPAPQFARLDY